MMPSQTYTKKDNMANSNNMKDKMKEMKLQSCSLALGLFMIYMYIYVYINRFIYTNIYILYTYTLYFLIHWETIEILLSNSIAF